MKNKPYSLAVVLALVLVPLQVAANPDPIITVAPLAWNYGKVELGEQAAKSFTITNDGGHNLIVYSIKFYNGGAAHYAILSQPDLPCVVNPGASVGVEVAFQPEILGVFTARLMIDSNDTYSTPVTVQLSGEGVEPTPQDPPTIEDILDYFDSAVDDGTLDGVGPCPVGRRAKLRIFRRRLVMAGRFHDQGHDQAACALLNWALLRSDGVPRPNDFVAGDSRQTLSDMIVWVLAEWGCE